MESPPCSVRGVVGDLWWGMCDCRNVRTLRKCGSRTGNRDIQLLGDRDIQLLGDTTVSAAEHGVSWKSSVAFEKSWIKIVKTTLC